MWKRGVAINTGLTVNQALTVGNGILQVGNIIIESNTRNDGLTFNKLYVTTWAATTYVGLENIYNTSDANKPLPTAMNTALPYKADQSSPTVGNLISLSGAEPYLSLDSFF